MVTKIATAKTAVGTVCITPRTSNATLNDSEIIDNVPSKGQTCDGIILDFYTGLSHIEYL